MHGCACKEYIFRSYNTSTFHATRFDEDPFTWQCGKEDKKASGFQISFVAVVVFDNIMAVNGLKDPEHALYGESEPVWPSGKALGW